MQTAISFLRADFPARPTEIQNTQKIANFAPHKGIPAAKSFQLQGLPLTSWPGRNTPGPRWGLRLQIPVARAPRSPRGAQVCQHL